MLQKLAGGAPLQQFLSMLQTVAGGGLLGVAR